MRNALTNEETYLANPPPEAPSKGKPATRFASFRSGFGNQLPQGALQTPVCAKTTKASSQDIPTPLSRWHAALPLEDDAHPASALRATWPQGRPPRVATRAGSKL